MDQNTRTLLLVRHAKAEQAPGKSDHDRELLPRGEADARAGGAWLVEHGLVPHLVLCSTASRAKQTWEHLAKGGELRDVEVWSDRRIYNAYPDEILAVVREATAEAQVVAVVGHAPGIPSLAAGLADPDASDPAALRALHEGMPTTAAAVLEVTGDWVDLDEDGARLVGLHTWRRPDEETA